MPVTASPLSESFKSLQARVARSSEFEEFDCEGFTFLTRC